MPTQRCRRSLFYKFDGLEPTEFCQIVYHQTSLIIETGAVNTFGDTERRNFTTLADAERQAIKLAATKITEGFTRVLEEDFDPETVDFSALRTELREGAAKAFESIRRAHADERINAFAIVSDDGAMSLAHIGNSAEALARRQEIFRTELVQRFGESIVWDCVWNASEWHYTEGAGFLDIPYRRVVNHHSERHGDSRMEFPLFRDLMFEASVAALEDLRNGKFFTKDAHEDEVVVLFQVSDSCIDSRVQNDWVRRLNSPSVYQRYLKWTTGA